MDKVVHDFIQLVLRNKELNKKDDMIRAVEQCFCLNKTGALYRHNDSFAVAFAYCKYDSFPNVVSSLKTLKKHDDIPCFVVVVKRKMENSIYMINSTFLDKISHSSQKLSVDKIVGSFLGSDIRKRIDENKENKIDDFDVLFEYHKGIGFENNLERLVNKTSGIGQKKDKVKFSEEERKNILEAPERALRFIGSGYYTTLLNDLNERCERVKDAILVTSQNDNSNIRGRLIEALITSEQNKLKELLKDLEEDKHSIPSYDTKNNLDDYYVNYNEWDVYTDIKTEAFSVSNPKAYNIDKFLKCMGRDNTVFFFFFIVINGQSYQTALVSVFHEELLHVYTQDVWSGRGTRGAAQFSSKIIKSVFHSKSFTNCINVDSSRQFLEKLLNR